MTDIQLAEKYLKSYKFKEYAILKSQGNKKSLQLLQGYVGRNKYNNRLMAITAANFTDVMTGMYIDSKCLNQYFEKGDFTIEENIAYKILSEAKRAINI